MLSNLYGLVYLSVYPIFSLCYTSMFKFRGSIYTMVDEGLL